MTEKATRLLHWLWITPFAALGWLGGSVVKLFRLAQEAIKAGFEQGKQI